MRQGRGRRWWTTRTSPPDALVSWTRLAAGESIRTAGDARVCVVEEDTPLRESLTNLLRSVGLQVAVFASAQEFLRSQRPEGPSCLVLDVRLPGLSGLELQQRLAEADLAMPGFDHRVGHCGVLRMTVESMHTCCLRCVGLPKRELGGPTP